VHSLYWCSLASGDVSFVDSRPDRYAYGGSVGAWRAARRGGRASAWWAKALDLELEDEQARYRWKALDMLSLLAEFRTYNFKG
jgi:hypothetical protein